MSEQASPGAQVTGAQSLVTSLEAAGTSNDDIKYARDLAPDFDEDEL